MKLATCHSMPSNHYVDKIENTIDILWLFGLNIFIHFSVLPCSPPCSSYVSHWFSLTEFETIRNRPQPQHRDAAPSHVRCASDSPGLAAVQFDQRGARPRAWRRTVLQMRVIRKIKVDQDMQVPAVSQFQDLNSNTASDTS